MGTMHTYRLTERGGSDACHIIYGACIHPPFADDGLWFVTLPAHSVAASGADVPLHDFTFIVPNHFAVPAMFETLRDDVEAWSEIAHRTYIGAWCAYYECPWADAPAFEHVLSTGSRVRYGYCRTQPAPATYPDRELWYVAFRHGPTFVVDHISARPAFIERMGDDDWKWYIICWRRLGSEVQWDWLVAGQSGGGDVRENPAIALDSPYLPPSLAVIEQRIATYESLLAAARREGRHLTLYDLLRFRSDQG